MKKEKEKSVLAAHGTLEGCPFCGSGDAELGVMEGLHKEPLFWVSCRNCGVSTRPNSQASTAVALWNQRAESAPEPCPAA
jgi:Lar family restriction alleviation protein